MTKREIDKKYLNFKTNAIVVDGEVFERDTDNLNMVDWKNFVHVGCELPIGGWCWGRVFTMGEEGTVWLDPEIPILKGARDEIWK